MSTIFAFVENVIKLLKSTIKGTTNHETSTEGYIQLQCVQFELETDKVLFIIQRIS